MDDLNVFWRIKLDFVALSVIDLYEDKDLIKFSI